MRRESMQYDVVIVGAGPAGLSAAIKLRQLSNNISVCVIEKGSEVGAHIISGAVFEPRALDELIPDWKNKNAPLNTPVTGEEFLFLSEKKSWRIPNWLLIPEMKNHGNYVISLGNLCRWLAEQAIELGAEIYPGFAAAEILYHEDGSVKGIATGNMGLAKDGGHKENFAEGMELHGKYTLFSEGCRGSLSEMLITHFNLRANKDPQTYGIGIKEIWEINPTLHKPGRVQHTASWPLDKSTYGGSFIYHMENNQISVGFVIGLDYQNTYLDPFKEMQRFKTHPHIKPLFEGAKRIAYGARALNEGGLQSLPELIFPGGALIGCSAGFLNVPKIKGNHAAMKSGMLAAEAVFNALNKGSQGRELLEEYPKLFRKSWLYEELYTARNFRAYFRFGLWLGTLFSGLDLKLFRGKFPWTLRHQKKDRNCLKTAKNSQKITYPKPDGVVSFDRMSSVFLSNIRYDENQPVHLHLKNPQKAINISYKEYASPEERYCPAGVYEIIRDQENKERLQINAANCVQCKTCDIKDPTDNIVWVVPEGGSGPNYPNM